jgi:TRAP-type C4-dicarboxylate transport system permease small subunit
MKKIIFILFFVGSFSTITHAQCSVCTKSASQLGEKPAKALNSAIVYLMLAPFAIAGFIGYRWWKNNKSES